MRKKKGSDREELESERIKKDERRRKLEKER